MQISIRRLRQVNAALSALSGRTLPTIASDLKVAARLRELRGDAEDSENLIRKAREGSPVPDGLEGSELPVALLEARQKRIDEILDATVDIPDVPDTKKITEADLPKALKTGAAEENRAGVADIVLNLDFLYAHPAEE